MAEQTSRRVVIRRVLGAALVISAAALVLPRLFDGSGVVPQVARAELPAAPRLSVPEMPEIEYLEEDDVLSVIVETPVDAQGIERLSDEQLNAGQPASDGAEEGNEQAREGEASSQSADVSANQASNQNTSQNSAPVAVTVGWVVQLASFSEVANAQRLLQRVRDAGHASFIRDSLLRDGRTLYQVMVGPIANEADARQLKTKLDADFSMSSLVLNFKP